MTSGRQVKVTVGKEFAGKRLDAFLARAVPGLTVERARALSDAGAVRIRGKAAQAVRKLWGGEEVEIAFPAPRHFKPVQGARIAALFEDDAFVIVNKPPGLVVEKEPGQVSLVELVASQYRGFDVGGYAVPGVAHRLDKETTGCLALAKTDEALAALQLGFEEKRIDKRYLALVVGLVERDEERLEAPYGRDPANPRKYTTKVESPRRAALTYRVLQRFERAGLSLVEVQLETGRTHQIRVQLSEAGHTVVGDPLYGPKEAREHEAAKRVGRLALHAARLTLSGVIPGRDQLVVEAPTPDDFARGFTAG